MKYVNVIAKHFGLFVHAFRKKKGLTQEAFSEIIGMSRASIACMESGKQCPSCENLFRISEQCQFSLDDLMESIQKDNKGSLIPRSASYEYKIKAVTSQLEKNQKALAKMLLEEERRKNQEENDGEF